MTEIRSGILKSFNVVNYQADVQIHGSLGLWLKSIPVSKGIASAEMIAGRKVAVALFDPTNPTDAVVFAVYT